MLPEKPGCGVALRAFELGVTFFDTADLYGRGRSEELVCEALGTHRREIVIDVSPPLPVVDERRAYAEDEDTARALVAFACARIRGQVLLDALDRHSGLARWLEGQGFVRERPYTRMALGRDELFGDPRRLAAIAGPELG